MILIPSTPPSVTWKTVTLSNGDTFKLELTRPEFGTWLRAKCAPTVDEIIQIRLQCVTNWRDVFQPTQNGGRAELPFSQELFQSWCMGCPELFEAARALVAEFWTSGQTGDESKNLPAPPSAATPDTPSSDATAT